jgi:PPOX class probable FMN-dependent enzyme
MDANAICELEDLRDIYGPYPAGSAATRILMPHLHEHHRAFIALSPFLVIASADAQGFPDVSPKGDFPGFVQMPDEHTLIIPDRPGNKKLLTLSNIIENRNVSLIFFVPGRTDTVRVNGGARITAEPDVLAHFAVNGRLPETAIVIDVHLAWIHCAKALIRSQLWNPDAQIAAGALPSVGEMVRDQIGDFDAGTYDNVQRGWERAGQDRGAETRLWGV